jgi:hypothetical protein
MGLISMLLALAFTGLYIGKTMDKKPPLLERLIEKMTAHVDLIAWWGAAYGLAAMVVTLLLHYGFGDMVIRLIVNGLICTMALPNIHDRFVEKYRKYLNDALREELKNFTVWITKNEKYIGYAGAISSAVLFGMIFK